MHNHKLRLLGLSLSSLSLSACMTGGLLTTVGPDYHTPTPPTDSQWHAPQSEAVKQLAHQGDPSDLKKWWQRFNDPVFNRLLEAAQNESASVAGAKARIEESRANLVGADGALLPSLDSSMGIRRSSSSFGGPAFVWMQYQIGLQSSWEIDLFGGLARQQESAISQLESRNAGWHDARIAVAVEVANAYLAYRYCETQAQLLSLDADSRRASSKLSVIAQQAGFKAQSDVALANASTAEGNRILLAQQSQCERAIKGLVAITGLQEAQLRQWLAQSPNQLAKLPTPPPFKIASVPATVLLQRPDVAAAERDVAEASAHIGVEQAKRFPKLSLSGNITPTLQNINGAALMLAQTWAIGPTISLPLFDAGKRAADVDVARAQYEASVSTFRSKVRTAVKEVEEALVRLDSVDKRLPEARSAVSGYQTNFKATQSLFEVGLGSLMDVETARRTMLSAELAIKELEQEQVSAWIALYRAAGGSWEDTDAIGENSHNEADPQNKTTTEKTDFSGKKS